jgi:hypothetical protein
MVFMAKRSLVVLYVAVLIASRSCTSRRGGLTASIGDFLIIDDHKCRG